MAGNHVIFIHPDGTSPAHYSLARFVEYGPDGRLNWDKLEEARVYLGHMEDQLTGTSNGGAVTHATGTKVHAESYGLEEDNETPTTALSGRQQTIMEEAVAAGKVTALINSGFLAEPGAGAFVAKVAPPPTEASSLPRNNLAEITKQTIESGVNFIMAGGELHMLPVGTTGFHVTPEVDAAYSEGDRAIQNRPSENLIELAEELGYTVVYTRDQLNELLDPSKTPEPPEKVLGVFAAIHTFNDLPEEVLAEQGLPLYVETAPTVAEMLKVTQTLMEQHPNFDNGSFSVLEEEGTDNFGNNNNAPGTLEGLRRADAAIGQAIKFYEKHPNTLIVTAADSDAGGLQIDDVSGETVETIQTNPTRVEGLPNAFENPLDGQDGLGTEPFVAAPAENGNVYEFGVGWAGLPDFAGSIVAKAHGLNSDQWPATIDNTDIYRIMYETLFPVVELPDRPVPESIPAPEPTADMGNVIFIHPDGTSPSIFGAARFVTEGPDGRLNWDMMENSGVYLGHMRDQLTGTSNAGAVTHAMGVKAPATSFGLDEDGNPVVSRSGKQGITILEEAIAAGKGTAVINSGFIAEPGTGAFLAEVERRSDVSGITTQIVESGVDVILGGGEIHYLPKGIVGRFGQEGIREDGRNLIEEAEDLGYNVVYTLEELQNLPENSERVLGIFAAEDTYNDQTEEQLAKDDLPFYGQPGNEHPPTVSQMLEAALGIVSKDPDGFFIVTEEEGTDNFGNPNNAAGTIEAALRADEAIGVAMDFVRNQDPNTLVITAADSEAGGLQVYEPTPYADAFPDTLDEPPTIGVNPTTEPASRNPLDGEDGRLAPWTPFDAEDSLDGPMGNFGVGWVGTPDFSGSIVSKTYGLNADLLPSTLDNTEIYRIMYQTLFGLDSLPNYLEGNSESQPLAGTEGDDVIVAFGGDDTINGLEGDDILYGGTGSDTFVLTPGQGINTINDFELGEDTISLESSLTFGDLTISESSGNAIILAADETLAVLSGVKADDLIAAANSPFTVLG